MNFKSILLFIVTCIFVSYIIINNQDQERIRYENFLLSQYDIIPNHSQEELKEIPKPEHPHMATFQNHFMSLDPALGYVPPDRLHAAFLRTREMQNEFGDRQIEWQNVPSNMGGRTRAIMFDPNDSNQTKVWAGGVSGGLWYNNDITDLNTSWNSIDDFWDNLSVSRIIYDPLDSEIFYVATGEANTALVTYRESSSRGIGIWKSTEAGAPDSWEVIPSTSGFQYVTDISVKISNNQSEIYAAVVSGTYQGQNHESSPSEGLFRSRDNGETWEQVLPNIPGTNTPYSPADIEITSSGKIFIGTMKNLNGEGGAVILSSLSGDINSWTINNDFQEMIQQSNNNNIPGRIIFSSCQSSPEVVYGAVGSGNINNMGFNLSYGNYLIKSIDAGESWTLVNLPTSNGSDWASLAWHALEIEVSPEDPQIVFIGGLELYKSTNGGNTWNNLSDWDLMYYGGGDRYIHADIHQVAFQPNNPNTIAVTSDGGVFLSTNALSNTPIFIERNQGYNTLQFYTGDISNEYESINFVGGLQDNGTLLYQESALDINDMITGGDGAFCFFDDNEPIVITSTYYNAWYFINMDTNDYSYENASSGVFINPADYDSQNNIIYANKVRFNGSQSNRIIKISNIPNNPNTETISLNTGTSVYFSALKLSPYSNQNTLFMGSQSGRLYKIENVNTDPNTIEIGSSLFPTANISSIDIGDNENEIMVTFSNYGVSSIWLTLDGGDSWMEKESNLPDMPVRWGILHPNDINFALIATEIGVWKTSNLQSENPIWIPSVSGLANVRVDMLSMRDSDNMVLAVSHGRGLFYGEFNLEVEAIGDLNNDQTLNILDVIILVNLILSGSSYDNLADINSDQDLNILDIILLVNMVLDD
ncbi:MAG: hypothetical protein CMG25_04045 [Candidatus Marinimicrobia bacterium]|nr:hypothetical protein [Candidatus Neomarinimicrobiota bacterium]|tara:strand:+ start:4514 stop:7132 length:2619 start_codon:yes stop_codon:yes gene_type:complete